MTITNGSAKQIEWATQIADKAAPRIAAIRAHFSAMKTQALRDAAVGAIDAVAANQSAAFWIDDTRHGIGNGGSLLDLVLTDAIVAAILASPAGPKGDGAEAGARRAVAKQIAGIK